MCPEASSEARTAISFQMKHPLSQGEAWGGGGTQTQEINEIHKVEKRNKIRHRKQQKQDSQDLSQG